MQTTLHFNGPHRTSERRQLARQLGNARVVAACGSPRRDSAPMRVMMAISSSTMAGSSTKTASGRFGTAGSETTAIPSDARQVSYWSCCPIALPISMGCRSTNASWQSFIDALTARLMAVSGMEPILAARAKERSHRETGHQQKESIKTVAPIAHHRARQKREAASQGQERQRGVAENAERPRGGGLSAA